LSGRPESFKTPLGYTRSKPQSNVAFPDGNRRPSQPQARTASRYRPDRLTFRVSRNLDPIDSDDVCIDVDETLFHRSVNDVDQPRDGLFMDIMRPNHPQPALDAAIAGAALIASSFKTVFHKNWAVIR
jgi:beta-hydroxylase